MPSTIYWGYWAYQYLLVFVINFSIVIGMIQYPVIGNRISHIEIVRISKNLLVFFLYWYEYPFRYQYRYWYESPNQYRLLVLALHPSCYWYQYLGISGALGVYDQNAISYQRTQMQRAVIWMQMQRAVIWMEWMAAVRNLRRWRKLSVSEGTLV